MPVEIERKFLLADGSWRDVAGRGVRMSQGYLSKQRGRTVRVRVAGEQAWLTIKGASEGISRAEFEYPLPVDEAVQLLELCEPSVIDKTRYEIPFGGHVWEVDVFHGENEGLVVAEIELADENERFEMPPWVGAEVSDDRRYANSVLSVTPFRDW
ncbi:MAG TPA: CYTH domain-containing protein [Luteolibacter sp.]|nr:CYTH domain-containing protein [Luteolibacter sp.]